MVEIGGLSKSARPMPLVILADRSGSMTGNKITSLNQALEDMVQELKSDSQTANSTLLALFTFGGNVTEDILFQPISSVTIPTLSAGGGTPIGQCFRAAVARLSDKKIVPERAIKPVIALISDGQPTDDWKEPLNELINHRRVGMAVRTALAIGDDANREMLNEFVSPEYPVLQANEVEKIKTFFLFITWASKSHSQGENLPDAPPSDLLQ